MKPVVIKARDGLKLQLLPDAARRRRAEEPADGALRPRRAVGPRQLGLQPQAQWLANRGYAVLQVNFRASTGYGKKFLNAGNQQWGPRCTTTCSTPSKWAIEQGIADPKTVAIFGGSYGGYAALAGATFTPDVFACAVDIVGPSNLKTLLDSIPPYWKPMRALFDVADGQRRRPEGRRADPERLAAVPGRQDHPSPLLIGQGANDPRVKRSESEQIVDGDREEQRQRDLRALPRRGPRLRAAGEPDRLQRARREVPRRATSAAASSR